MVCDEKASKGKDQLLSQRYSYGGTYKNKINMSLDLVIEAVRARTSECVGRIVINSEGNSWRGQSHERG